MYFDIQLPGDYPFNPPKFKFLTPNNGQCRMHPNLYAEGKVCLSVLNTWHSNQWSAQNTLLSVLQIIQSRLHDNPITNEPSFETRTLADHDAESYQVWSRWLVLTAAVNFFLTRKDVPDKLMFYARRYFVKHQEIYRQSVEALRSHIPQGETQKAFRCLHGSIMLNHAKIDEVSGRLDQRLAEIMADTSFDVDADPESM